MDLTAHFPETYAMASRYADAVTSGDRAALRTAKAELIAFTPEAVDPAALAAAITFMSAAELPTGPGIYLITADVALSATCASDVSYVGCARNIHARFHLPLYGHLRNNSTTSRHVLAHDQVAFGVLTSAPGCYDGLDDATLDARLAVDEVFFWLLLTGHAHTLVNATSSLGRTASSALAPVVVCELDSGRHRVFATQSEATRVLGLLTGQVNVLANRWQNQTNGYAARHADDADLPLLAAGWVTAEAFTAASACSWDGAHVRWEAGALPDADRTQLNDGRRSGYDVSKKVRYRGVTATPNKPGLWTAYYVYDPARRSCWRAVGRAFTTPEAAAEAREAFLNAHPDLAAINRRNDLASEVS